MLSESHKKFLFKTKSCRGQQTVTLSGSGQRRPILNFLGFLQNAFCRKLNTMHHPCFEHGDYLTTLLDATSKVVRLDSKTDGVMSKISKNRSDVELG